MIECRDGDRPRSDQDARARGPRDRHAAATAYACVQPFVNGDEGRFFARLEEVAGYLAGSRPTAVNLFSAERMKRAAAACRGRKSPRDACALPWAIATTRRIGESGDRATGRNCQRRSV